MSQWKVSFLPSLSYLGIFSDAFLTGKAMPETLLNTRAVAERLYIEERFDLVVPRDYYFTKPVQALLTIVASASLKTRATTLGGYDVQETGKVAFPE